VALNITCESCHGGGAKHVAAGGDPSRISASLDVDSCEPCHGGERQVGALTSMGHYTVFEEFSSTVPYYRDSCMECHSATVRIMEEKGETPPTLADFRTGAYQDDRIGITCVVCHDPHERSHEAQLREDTQETCTQCHTAELATETFTAGKAVHHPMKEMWEGIGAIGVDPMPAAKKAECVDCHMTNGNHYFEVGTPIITLPVHGKPTDFNSCASCHNDMTAEKIEAVFAAFEEELADLNALLAQVDEHIGREQGFGRDMSAAKALRDKAYTNISFAEADGSKGIHNPAYVEAMLQAAREYLEEAMRQ
jgi:predicted CXXCH cytochrome family protein